MNDLVDQGGLAGARFADQHHGARRRATQDLQDRLDRLIEPVAARQFARVGFERHDAAVFRERFEIDVARELIAEPALEQRVGAVDQSGDARADIVQRLGRRPGQIVRKAVERIEMFLDGGGAGLLDAGVDVLAEPLQQIAEDGARRTAAQNMRDLAANPQVVLVVQSFEQRGQESRTALGGPGGVLAQVGVRIGQQLLDGGVHLDPGGPVLEVVAELVAHLDFAVARQLQQGLHEDRIGLPAARCRRRLAFDLRRRAREGEQHERIAADREPQGIDEGPKRIGIVPGVVDELIEIVFHGKDIIRSVGLTLRVKLSSRGA